MGLLAEFELREIQPQPWYGTLANHAVAILAAVAAAMVGEPLYGALDRLIPGQEPLVFFISTMAMAIVFEVVNVLLVIPTLAMKGGLTLAEARHTPDASIRATALAEAILAWNLAAAYLMVGWWAPIAVVALVIVVWQHHAQGEALRRDPMTGLLNSAGLRPFLDVAVNSAATGRRPSALLIIDLNRFKAINDTYLEKAGDEVIVVTSRRILMTVRAMDSVSRLHGAGDEFGVLLEGVPDVATAKVVANRIHAAICEPIRLRSAPATVSVGASIGVVLIELGTTMTPDAIVDLGDVRMQAAKRTGRDIDAETLDDAASQAGRIAAEPRRKDDDQTDEPERS
ncbi:MAG: GGDEF domain-containing protein [Chloroflexi bacterium]|nr:GGDEF domain-containing protein [Chloroflexota bacterium]